MRPEWCVYADTTIEYIPPLFIWLKDGEPKYEVCSKKVHELTVLRREPYQFEEKNHRKIFEHSNELANRKLEKKNVKKKQKLSKNLIPLLILKSYLKIKTLNKSWRNTFQTALTPTK